jgi:hypothetical protein
MKSPSADRGELRTGAVHRAVHGRRGRQLARRGDRKPGQADPLGEGHADPHHLRRRTGLCLARRRHHHHVDVTLLPENAFGYVPTPALVAPIEFTMRREDYEALGGHMKHVMPLAEARAGKKAIQNDHILAGQKGAASKKGVPWPTDERHFGWSKSGRKAEGGE